MRSTTRRPGRTDKPGDPPAPSRHLERGREAYGRQAWQDAFASLTDADRESPLDDQDLERLAWTAALAGHEDIHLAALERLHDLRAAAGNACSAARAAFWLGMRLLAAREVGKATGWLGRAERLIENQDCVERGFLLIPRG